ncbi:MAG TPA: hypothetical protein VF621_05075 [Pyrinomonadaceae bacterium]
MPAAAGVAEEPAARTVKYVVNRPYSAGEPFDIVDAQVEHEYEGEEDLLRLRLIDPPRGVEEDQKRVRRSGRREVGTWFEETASEEAAADGNAG